MEEEQKREFKGVWIPKEIWLNEELSALDKFIFAEIDSLCGENGCSASNEYIAKFCHCSESMVSKSIAQLIKLGLIKKKSFDGRIRVLEVCLVKNASLTSKKCYAEYENLPPINIDHYSKEKIIINNNLKESETLSFPKESTIVATTTNEEIKENLQLRPAKEKKEKFVKPTIEDVEQYCKERDNGINAIKWYDYYEANGWRVGKNPMKDWKAAVRTWEHNYKKDNIESKNNISNLPEFEY